MANSTLTETGVCCPFCGHARTEAVGPCPRCTMEDTPTTRAATAGRVGPWFVLQRKNPTAPGLRYSVLLSLVKRGLVTADSVLRGPTTQQLWRRATQVRGVARTFGVCWNCASSVGAESTKCVRCGESQDPPADPDLFLDGVISNEPTTREATSTSILENKSNESIEGGFESPRPRDTNRDTPREFIDRDQPTRATGSKEVIMSARELAAVFQLNPAAVREPSRTRHLIGVAAKLTLATLLIATTGIAAALYVKPELRDPLRQKLNTLLGRHETPLLAPEDFAHSSIVNDEPTRTAIEPEPQSIALAPTTQPSSLVENTTEEKIVEPTDPISIEPESNFQPQIDAPTNSISESQSNWPELFEKAKEEAIEPDSIVPDESQSNDSTNSAFDQPTTQPTVEEKIEPTIEENPEPTPPLAQPEETSPPVTTEAPSAAPEVESTPTEVPTMPTLEDPRDQLRELRIQAANFERKGKFIYAIQCYEMMRDLPEDVRPTNIDTQINRLKRRAGVEDDVKN